MKKYPWCILVSLVVLTACQPAQTPSGELKLDTPLSYTQSRQLILLGQGTDLQKVEAEINGQRFQQTLTPNNQQVRLPVLLQRGLNEIKVTGYSQGTPTIQKLSVTLGTQVLAGSAHSGLLSQGRLYGWGRNNQGQIGGTDKANMLVPKLLKTPETLVSLAGGMNSTLMLGTSGQVYQLGLLKSEGKESTFVTTPTKAPNLNQVALIASGQYHRLAINHAGELYSWGHNSAGQLAQPLATTYSAKPFKIKLDQKVISVAGGGSFSLAATKKGQVYAWGDGKEGQLGRTEDKNHIPTLIPNLKNVVMVAAGKSHALALTQQGEVYTWGDNFTGQLGRPLSSDQEQDAQPVKLEGLKATQIYASGNFSLALTADGTAYGWGQNFSGNLGLGKADADVLKPTKLPLKFDQLAAGLMHTVALNNQKEWLTAGLNSFGQIGNGKVGLDHNARTFSKVALP